MLSSSRFPSIIFFALKCSKFKYAFRMRRGFQGVMKRWGFAGMPAGHGVTKSHRRPGCIGSGRDKGRVWPGQKMPGHVGGNKVRMLGLKVLRVDFENDILYIKGQSLPGWPGEFLQLFDCKLNEK